MAKGKSLAIKLVSMAGTGFYYMSKKNPKLPRTAIGKGHPWCSGVS